MTDMSFFPSVYGGIDYRRYNADQFNSSIDYAIWTKPRGARWIYFLIVGAGQGGAGGLAVAAGAAAGGGGGGSGGAGRALAPAIVVPNRLWLQVARGGLGGAPGAAGGQQTLFSQIGVFNSSGHFNFIAIASTGTAPSAPTTVKQTTAGVHSFNASSSFIPFFASAAGGALGDIVGTGANGTAGSCSPLNSGAAGAGCAATYAAANGGVSNFTSLHDGALRASSAGIGATTGGTSGSDGPTIWTCDGLVPQSAGGAGGGNASTGTAGNGGKGGLGSGGGGGGAASGTGGVAGSGGPGGDGVIIIACW